jgi:hypothetical protein
MSYQGTATISRESTELSSVFHGMGFEWVTPEMVRLMLDESDVLSTEDYDAWVDAADSTPGDLERYPHIVYCVQSTDPGSAVAKTYKPVS